MALLDPRALACLAVLVVNDFVLKAAYGNWLTGKLSDFTGVVVLAVLVAEVLGLVGWPRRRRAMIGVAAAAACLVSVKLSGSAAGAVEAAAGFVGLPYRIVVDQTDLLALAALPLAWVIAVEPRPLTASPLTGRVTLGFACLACVASGGPGTMGIDHVDVADDGTVVAAMGFDIGGELDVRGTWVATESGYKRTGDIRDFAAITVTESCSPSDQMVCLRLGPGSRIAESTDGGASYSTAWELNDGSWWEVAEWQDPDQPRGSVELIQSTDLAWTEDGVAYVAMSDRLPTVRLADGSFRPTVADLKPFPTIPFLFMLAAWLIGALFLWFNDRVRQRRGGRWAVAASMICVGGGLLATWAEGFGVIPALLVAAPLAAICLLVALFRMGVPEDAIPGFTLTRLVALAWPALAILAAAFAWDYALISWLPTQLIMVAAVAGGWVLSIGPEF